MSEGNDPTREGHELEEYLRGRASVLPDGPPVDSLVPVRLSDLREDEESSRRRSGESRRATLRNAGLGVATLLLGVAVGVSIRGPARTDAPNALPAKAAAAPVAEAKAAPVMEARAAAAPAVEAASAVALQPAAAQAGAKAAARPPATPTGVNASAPAEGAPPASTSSQSARSSTVDETIKAAIAEPADRPVKRKRRAAKRVDSGPPTVSFPD